jgi:hypothetical protein
MGQVSSCRTGSCGNLWKVGVVLVPAIFTHIGTAAMNSYVVLYYPALIPSPASSLRSSSAP